MGTSQSAAGSLVIEKRLGAVAPFCHHGVRSLGAATWLRSQGVEGARPMTDRIDRWAIEIDPRMPRY
jgi:rhodanese-related sulfurtransferase